MCGIAGFCNGSQESMEMIRSMTDRIIRRGPDSEGYWMEEDKSVVLGHRRLAILDCSDKGAQPMASANGRYVVSYNGEIYNYLELRSLLEKGGVTFRGTSDTETLVEFFDMYGVKDTLEKIKGMFAIALYDKKDRVLYLMRDRVGEKPLYYGHIDGKFAFASEPACFEAVGRLETDPGAVELFFRRGYIPAPYSIYKGIRKLEPGHYLRIQCPYEEAEDITYWSSYDVSRKCHDNEFKGNIREAEEELERLLKSALKGQMLSDVPLGAFLSAGIDSSTVVALMQEISSDPVRTFTVGVDTPGYNEAPIARSVSEILGTSHTEEYVSVPEIKAVIPDIASMYSEPFADSSQIPTSIISKVARKNVTVVLSGDGGDELFCGYGRYNGWVHAEWNKQQRLPLPLQKMRSTALHMAGKGNTAKARKLMAGSIAGTYAAVSGSDTEFVRSDVLYDDYLDIFAREGKDRLPTDQDTLMQMDFGEYLPDDILAKVDRAAMYHSLETRIPYLDRDVIEFIWTLPLDMKYSNGVTKQLLRRILYKRVSADIMERPKTGFSIPLDQWMREGDLKEWAWDLFEGSPLEKASEFLDVAKCRKIWRKFSDEGIWDGRIWYMSVFLQWFNFRINA